MKEEGWDLLLWHFLLSTQVPLARNVSAPADEVVLCNGHCPAHLFTVLGLYGEFFCCWLYWILSAVAISVRNVLCL